jgi:hypothetical protein
VVRRGEEQVGGNLHLRTSRSEAGETAPAARSASPLFEGVLRPPSLKISRTDDFDDPPRASAQTIVDREQSAAKNPRQCNIFGIVGLGPTELIGDAPRLSAESTRCPGGNRRREQRVERG